MKLLKKLVKNKESLSKQLMWDSLSLQMGTNKNNSSRLKGIKPIWSNKEKQKIDVKIEFLYDALLIDESVLVLGDLHIGYEEHITKSGIFPRLQLKEIIEKLDSIFWNLSMKGIFIKQVIILGDLKHEFGEISDVEWSETLRFLDYLDGKIVKKKIKDYISNVNTKEMKMRRLSEASENTNKLGVNNRIILVRGNHDNILGPIAKKRNIDVVNYYKYKNICFMHGNKIYGKCFEKSEILILGHLHPAITLSDEYKKEKYKCFLHGKWKTRGNTKDVYILPSFSPISFGFNLENLDEDIKDEGGFLIINDKELKDLEVIIYNNKENKEYNFGKLKKLV